MKDGKKLCGKSYDWTRQLKVQKEGKLTRPEMRKQVVSRPTHRNAPVERASLNFFFTQKSPRNSEKYDCSCSRLTKAFKEEDKCLCRILMGLLILCCSLHVVQRLYWNGESGKYSTKEKGSVSFRSCSVYFCFPVYCRSRPVFPFQPGNPAEFDLAYIT